MFILLKFGKPLQRATVYFVNNDLKLEVSFLEALVLTFVINDAIELLGHANLVESAYFTFILDL